MVATTPGVLRALVTTHTRTVTHTHMYLCTHTCTCVMLTCTQHILVHVALLGWHICTCVLLLLILPPSHPPPPTPLPPSSSSPSSSLLLFPLLLPPPPSPLLDRHTFRRIICDAACRKVHAPAWWRSCCYCASPLYPSEADVPDLLGECSHVVVTRGELCWPILHTHIYISPPSYHHLLSPSHHHLLPFPSPPSHSHHLLITSFPLPTPTFPIPTFSPPTSPLQPYELMNLADGLLRRTYSDTECIIRQVWSRDPSFPATPAPCPS